MCEIKFSRNAAKYILTIVVALFVVLTRSNAFAATMIVDRLDLTFYNDSLLPNSSLVLTGDLGISSIPEAISPDRFPTNIFPYPPHSLSLNGKAYYMQTGEPSGYTLAGVFWNPTDFFSQAIVAQIAISPSLIPQIAQANLGTLEHLTYKDFLLDGVPAYSGSVICVSGCDVSPIPLPPSLSLFVIGLFAFSFFHFRHFLERAFGDQAQCGILPASKATNQCKQA